MSLRGILQFYNIFIYQLSSIVLYIYYLSICADTLSLNIPHFYIYYLSICADALFLNIPHFYIYYLSICADTLFLNIPHFYIYYLSICADNSSLNIPHFWKQKNVKNNWLIFSKLFELMTKNLKCIYFLPKVDYLIQ